MFASFADACRRLEHWIHYYNHQRPRQGTAFAHAQSHGTNGGRVS